MAGRLTLDVPRILPDVSRRRVLLAGTCLLGYGALVTRFAGPPGRRERAVFATVNDASHQSWLRVPQQWGTPWTLPAVAVVAAAQGRRADAVVALACLPVVKGIEVATKKWRPRPRPIHTQPTELRDDAPVEGGSMPSGHAALAACGTVLLLPVAPRPVGALLIGVTAVSAWIRVHQGAHQPVDVVAGVLLGGAVGLAASDPGQSCT